MTVRARSIACIGGLLFFLAAARNSLAADQEAALNQITSLNKGAIAAYSDGDFDKAKRQLLQAAALGKKDSEIQNHPLMARTYVHLGVLYVDGLEERDAGVRYFVKALKIRPDIEVTQVLATKTVKSAFEEAKGEAGGSGGGEAATVAASASKADKAEKAEKSSASEEPEEEAKPEPKLTAAEKRKAAADEKRAALEEKKEAAEEAKRTAADERRATAEEKKKAAEEARLAAAEEKRAAKEAKEKDRQTRDDREKLTKELAQVQGTEAKERAAKEKLQTEKAEKEALLSDTKGALEQLKKEAKEHEKQAQAEKERLTKELAQLRESEAKERAAKEKLQTEKAEKEKQLADAKGSIQQLQKEKADKEKQLADTAGREKKERETKEKLEKERQLAEAREKERKEQQEKERLHREKLAAGPDLPSRIPEPLHCAVPDEAQAGAELFVHCAPRSDVKPKSIALYYRQSGGVHYNSLAMEPSKKGWFVATIPAEKVTGKLLQYYAEVRDGRDKVAAATGKPTSPNILTLKSTPIATTAFNDAPKATTAGRSKPKR